MVGERGFEPPTPWSRTRFQSLLRFIEICGSQLIDIEPVAGCPWKAIEICWSRKLSPTQNRLHRSVIATAVLLCSLSKFEEIAS